MLDKTNSPNEQSEFDLLVASVEEDIVFGKLHPRERLVEEEIMERFQIKRHVARDILMQLERLGLVERKKNVGALVRSFTPKEVAELYQVRVLLETEAVRSIEFPVAQIHIDELSSIQQEQDKAIAANDLRKVFRLNLAFHQRLFDICNNEVLKKAISEYARQTHSIRFSTLISSNYRERSSKEHWDMIQALQKGRRDELIKICGDHLLPSRDTYLSINQLKDQ